MYLIDDLIDLGLAEGETFKSEDHRQVCIALGIGIPGVDTADQLVSIVTAVQKVPLSIIRNVTLAALIEVYKLNTLPYC